MLTLLREREMPYTSRTGDRRERLLAVLVTHGLAPAGAWAL